MSLSSAFHSEDEYQQDSYYADDSDSLKDFDHSYDAEYSDSLKDFDHSYDEDQISDHREDIDEYANFSTDYGKYQYDQVRWNGIPNPRKYTIVKKKAKGKREGENQEKETKEDKSARSTRRKKQDKPNPHPSSSKRSKRSSTVPLEQAVEIPKGGQINFDARGGLWYSHKVGDVYLSERSTFHHWIRPGLSRSEDAKGTYDFPRQRGVGNYDVTCFNEVQEHWGLDRAHYAPVMFEWEPLDRANPDYQLENLYHEDLLVLDYWHMPVRNFREIPLVISSAIEGGFVEPATRMHSEMAYEDIRARMPPFVEVRKRGQVSFKALSKASTISGRCRHFREAAGAISWDKREGSATIKTYIEKIVKPILNSTFASRDLTKNEIKQLRLMNGGTKPARAKPGTSQKAKEKYIADIRKAASLTTPNIMTHEDNDVKDEMQEPEMENEEMSLAQGDSHQGHADPGWHVDYSITNDDELYETWDEFIVNEPITSNADIEDQCTAVEVNDTTPPRFVFCCTEKPFLQSMTEQQALMHPLVNMSDPRNQIPKFQVEVAAIRDALQVTVEHFMEIFGYEPIVYQGSNYVSEYCNIQDQFDFVFEEDAIQLRRLGRWEGTIFDWEQANVEDDPCFGRMTQLFF